MLAPPYHLTTHPFTHPPLQASSKQNLLAAAGAPPAEPAGEWTLASHADPNTCLGMQPPTQPAQQGQQKGTGQPYGVISLTADARRTPTEQLLEMTDGTACAVRAAPGKPVPEVPRSVSSKPAGPASGAADPLLASKAALSGGWVRLRWRRRQASYWGREWWQAPVCPGMPRVPAPQRRERETTHSNSLQGGRQHCPVSLPPADDADSGTAPAAGQGEEAAHGSVWQGVRRLRGDAKVVTFFFLAFCMGE